MVNWIGVFPSGKMLLERFGCTNVKVIMFSPSGRGAVHLEGASATVQQAAKHPKVGDIFVRWWNCMKSTKCNKKLLLHFTEEVG